MGLLDNSIGMFTFAGMNGVFIPPIDAIALDERDGVDGTEITLLGVKGRPFTIRTWVDKESYQDAVLEFNLYRTQIGGDPVEAVHAGINTDTDEGYKVAVLDVRPVDITACRPGAGGLNPPSLGMVIAEWDLLAINN